MRGVWLHVLLSEKADLMIDPSVFCDNHSTCKGLYLGRGNPVKTREAARARGWHFFVGTSTTGKLLDVALCPACVDAGRRQLPKAWKPLEGQETLPF